MLFAGSLFVGYRLFDEGRPIVHPLSSIGSYSLMVSDPNVVVEASTSFELDPSPEYAGMHDDGLNVSFLLKAKTRRNVGWALMLTGDYALSNSIPANGKVSSGGGDPIGFDTFDDDAASVTYFRNGGISDVGRHWTGIPGRSSLIVGILSLDSDARAPSDVMTPSADVLADPNRWSGEFSLTIPGPPPVHDAGASIFMNLPILGLPLPPPQYLGGSAEAYVQIPIDVYVDAPENLTVDLYRHDWRYPTDASWSFWLLHGNSEARLDIAFPPPVTPSTWIWESKDRLELDATFLRPSARSRRETSLFLSGLFLGVAAGFSLWILELMRDRVRRPRAWQDV